MLVQLRHVRKRNYEQGIDFKTSGCHPLKSDMRLGGKTYQTGHLQTPDKYKNIGR